MSYNADAGEGCNAGSGRVDKDHDKDHDKDWARPRATREAWHAEGVLMRTLRQNLLLLAALLMPAVASASTNDYAQDFDDWPEEQDFGTYSNAGWVLQDVRVRGDSQYWPASLDHACWLDDLYDDGTPADPWVRSPLLTNGIGTVSFAHRIRTVSYSAVLTVEVSTNGTVWTPVAAYTNANPTLWETNQCTVSTFDPSYVRIRRTGGSVVNSVYVGLDDIEITLPYPVVSVEGTRSREMLAVSTSLWQGVISPDAPLVDPVFRFESNQGGPWGDSNQAMTALPVYGDAELDGSNITVSGSITNHLAFLFDEATLDYSIQKCVYVNFDDWTGAGSQYSVYTNDEGWVIEEGRINAVDEAGRALSGKFCILKFDHGAFQALRSPYLTNGVGTISLWSRNWEDDGQPAAGFVIQKSVTGSGDWVTVSADAIVTNTAPGPYAYLTVTMPDRSARYVRILNSDETDSWLCLDEVAITEPGASVEFANPDISTTAPLIGDAVEVSVEVTPTQASNLVCRVYFRPDLEEGFDSIEMTASNGQYAATLPPTPNGAVHYYFECTYDGFNAAPARSPAAAPFSGYSYTNSMGQWRSQTFEDWPGAPIDTFDTHSDGLWTVQEGKIRGESVYLPAPPTNGYCAWLNTLSAGGEPLVLSPFLTNGVSTLYFRSRAFAARPQTFAVESSTTGSTNPLDWTVLDTFTNADYLVWATNVTEINSTQDIYLRIRKTVDGGQGNDMLGIDSVSISYPPAGIVITNTVYAPGYPSKNDVVTLYCQWFSENEAFPAFGFAPELVFRLNDGGWITNSMAIVGGGGTNQYSADLAPMLPGKVEYYIRGAFRGYYHTYETFSESRSPAFSPAAPQGAELPDTFHSYNVRYHQSEYDHIEISGNVGAADMHMIDDNLWLGVLTVVTPTNHISCAFNGLGEYTNGPGVYSTNINVWGDNDQPWFTPPLLGVGEADGSNIVLNLDSAYKGQLVFVYNLADGNYEVKKCAYQDFNEWRASEDYFEESLGHMDVVKYTNSFDAWVLSTTEVSSVTFDAPYEWETNDTYYSAPESQGGSFWYIEDALVLEEKDQNRATRFSELEDNIGAVWPHRSQLTDGLRAIDFRYRAKFDDHYHAWYTSGTAWNNYSVRALLAASDESPDCHLSMFGRYQDQNNYYELRVTPTNSSLVTLSLWKRKSGVVTKIHESSPFTASLSDAHDEKAELYVVDNNSGTVYLEGLWGVTRRTYGYDTVDPLTGAGSIGFLTDGADIKVDDVEVARADVQRFEQWSESTIGNYTNNGWTVTYGRPYSSAYCVLFAEVQNLSEQFESWGSATNWGDHSSADWLLTGGRIYEPAQSGSYSAQLNYYDGGPSASTLRTPLQSGGVASISFYTRHETGANEVPFSVETSPNGSPPWSNVDSLSSTTSGSWTYHYVEVENAGSIHVRFLKGTSAETNKWLAIDRVAIGRPVSEDSYTTSPELDYAPGSLAFAYTKHNYDYLLTAYSAECELKVLASQNGSTWDTLNTISPWSGTGTQYYNRTTGLGSYRFFRVEITSDSGIVRVEDFYISASTNTYSEDFSSGAPDWTGTHWSVDPGTKTYDRPGYAGPNINFEVQWAPTNNAGPGGPFEDWQTVTNFTATNVSYESRSVDVETWDKVFVRVAHTTGGGSLVVDDVFIESWRGETLTDGDGWKATEVRVGDGRTGNGLEFRRSRADPSAAQGLRTPELTNGLGALSFDFKVENGPVTIDLELADETLIFDSLTTNAIVLTNTSWTSYTTNLWTNVVGTAYLRVRHTSADSNAVFYMDNVEVTDYAERDDSLWVAYNALITPNSEEGRKFENYAEPAASYKTCYLNNDPTNRTETVLDDDRPFVQSPSLSAGIGEISFSYRCWEDTGAPPATVYICSGSDPSPEMTFDDWTLRGTLSNITNSLYAYFTTNYYIKDDEFIRIYAATSAPAAKVCLDNILIGEPVAVDLAIGNLEIIPPIPLYTNSVRFSAAVSNIFLSPTNLDVRAYYNIGTNDWGTWTPSDYVPLAMVSDDGLTRTYETPEGQGIPASSLDIDDVVQYYVECSFEGLFATNTSPKEQKAFTNPSWYSPVDLNAGQPDTNPYFFVYSCPTGAVWINEINVIDDSYYPDAYMQYVELCGRASVSISNWWIEVYNTSYVKKGHYTILSDSTLLDSTNGYGFWVLGDTNTSTRNMTLTNDLPDEGGIRLHRSMGAIEHAVCYDVFDGGGGPNLVPYGFEYIGFDDDWEDTALSMAGTGSNGTDFAWVNDSYSYSPGMANHGQNLIRTGNGPPDTIEIAISDIWLSDTEVHVGFTSTDTNALLHTLLCCTNLIAPSWGGVSNYPPPTSPGDTNWFTVAIPTDPASFYKVSVTNSP